MKYYGIDRDYYHIDKPCDECDCCDYEEDKHLGVMYYKCKKCGEVIGPDRADDGER